MSNTVSTGQYTIIDMNDINISNYAPSNPSEGDLWMDNSVNPPLLKMWNGYAWTIVNDYSGNIKDLQNQINQTNNNINNDKDKIKEVKEIQESNNVDIQKLKDRVLTTITKDELIKTTSTLNDKILSVANENSNNKHLIEETAQSTKDEIVSINQKIEDIRDTNDSAKVAQKIEILTTKTNSISKTLDATKETISSVKEITNNNSKEIRDNSLAIEKTNNSLNVKITEMDSKVDNATNKIVNLSANLDNVNVEIRQAGDKTKNLSDKVASLNITTDKISSKVDNSLNKLSKDVESSNSKVEQLSNKIVNTVSQETLDSKLEQTNRQFRYQFSDTTYYNILRNSSPQNTLKCWRVYTSYGEPQSSIKQIYNAYEEQGKQINRGIQWCGKNNGKTILINHSLAIDKYQFDTNSKYTLSGKLYGQYGCGTIRFKICDDDGSNCILNEVVHIGFMEWQKVNFTFKPNSTSTDLKLFIYNEDNSPSFYLTISYVMLNKGDIALPWSLSCLELSAGNTVVDRDGIEVYNGGFKVVNTFGDNTIYIKDDGLVASDRGFACYGKEWGGNRRAGIHYTQQDIWQISDELPIYMHTNDKFIVLKKNGSNGTFQTGKINCDELWVGGSKHRLVETEHYGKLGMNAIESANCIFEDDGRAKTINKKCRVPISNIFLETIEDDYDVILSVYGLSDLRVINRQPTYFDVVVKEGDDCEFYYIVRARQKGYAKDRLQEFKEE